MAAAEGPLRIGEVARRTGTTPRTIRYYEEFGLLTGSDDREPGSHRLYGEADVERVRELLRLKELLGVSLEELRTLVGAEDARAALRAEYHGGEVSEERRAEILTQALGHIGEQLELVRRRRGELERFEADLLARRKRIQRLRRKPERTAVLSS